MTTTVTTLGFPYDYDSIMHYDSYAFSMNGQPSMVPKQTGVTLKPGYQKTYLTKTDIGEIRALYGCT